MPIKTTVSVDGSDLEVEVPDDALKAAGYVPEANYVEKSFMEKELRRADERARNAARAEVEADEDFISGLIEKHAPKPKEFDADAFASSIRKKEVEPLKGELDALRTRVRNAEIVQAAAPHVRDEFVQKVAGKDPYVVSLLADRLEYDADLGFVATDGNGNRLPGSNGGYATASDLVEQFKQDDSLSFLFKPRERNGNGSSPSPGGSAPSGSGLRRSKMSAQEKVEYQEKNGREALEKLPY